jgi:hypothetical protein
LFREGQFLAKTAFHFLRIVITHRNRNHNMFNAMMQPRGATFCVFTAAVEKNYATLTTYTIRPRELKVLSFGPT